MSDQEFIIAPPTVRVGFDLLPVDGVINSMALLNQVEELSGFGEWAESTYNALSPERRHMNKVVFYTLLKAVDYQGGLDHFADFLAWLETLDPIEMRDKMIANWVEKVNSEPVDLTVTADDLLADKATYMHMIETLYRHWGKWDENEAVILADGYDLMQSPKLAHVQLVEHLTYMWDKHLRDEWNRNLPMLEECVRAFRQVDFSGKGVMDAIKAVTGRDMSEYWPHIDPVDDIVFLPSPHVGPYTAYFVRQKTMYVFFGMRMPEGVSSQSAALSRSELLIRLNALADDTRLTIIEMLTQHDELCAQDIMNQLNLSQSSASRHLRQLTASGFLRERRREVAKCYSLNTERLDSTLQALRHFMKRG